MARKITILRAVVFTIFFGTGLAALAVSLLADEMLSQCITKEQLRRAEKTNEKLEAVSGDYDAVFERIETDSNIIQRLARVTLGTASEDDQDVYPKVSKEQRRVAERVVSEIYPAEPEGRAGPDWMVRCREPWGRTVLFLAGGGLIIVSFTCFGSKAKAAERGE